MFERFTDQARAAVVGAKAKAAERGDAEVQALHLLSALTTGAGVASRVLTAATVDSAAVDRLLGPAPGGAASGSAAAPPRADDAEALRAIGIDLDEIKRRIEDSFGEGALGRVPLTPRGPLNWMSRATFASDAKVTLGMSLKEARALHHSYIGTEHLLLGLLRTAESKPRGNLSRALHVLDLDYPAIHRLVLAELARASA